MLVLLLVAAVAITTNVVVASSSSGATLNRARCNGSIAECHGERPPQAPPRQQKSHNLQSLEH
ncbi:hypothetical protein QJS10_CPB15g01397 [Acorus calamus]|uniref:Secreted protein n=1 Tax=Acorus calamus TaxID=4465 RepID=A0AAV9D958_ACOCL|nr:hypothetical protein QJS10_CPB15g01397 [Acorus calamus]